MSYSENFSQDIKSDTSDCKLTDYKLDNQGSNPERATGIFFFTTWSKIVLESTQPPTH